MARSSGAIRAFLKTAVFFDYDLSLAYADLVTESPQQRFIAELDPVPDVFHDLYTVFCRLFLCEFAGNAGNPGTRIASASGPWTCTPRLLREPARKPALQLLFGSSRLGMNFMLELRAEEIRECKDLVPLFLGQQLRLVCFA